MPSYVLPGTVGYLGSPGALTPYSPPGSGLPGAGNTPAGWSWTVAGMRNDTGPVTLDHAQVYGGIYTAANVLTVTNCVIMAGTASEIAPVQHHGAGAALGGALTVKDSTLGWLTGTAPPAADDVPLIFDASGPLYDVERCDLSGAPQGLDPPGSGIPGTPSLVLNNWIHGLVQNNPGNPNHMDGIFSQGGSYLTIQGNYIDAPNSGQVTAAVFFQDAATDSNIIVTQNYLSGGAFTFRNETGAGMVVTNNTFSGLNQFGDAFNLGASGATIAQWTGNLRANGVTVPNPAEVITATQTGSDANGIMLTAVVLTGAAAGQPGAAPSATQVTPSLAITPQASGSLVYGGILALSDAFVPLAGTTFLENQLGEGLQYGALVSSAATAAGVAKTLGSSATGANSIAIALAEILAAGPLVQDASTPAPVHAASQVIGSPQFAPPAPCLLVAVVSSNGGAGTVVMQVSDNSLLTWTELAKQNGAGNGYVGIWAAPLTSITPPSAVTSQLAAALLTGML